MMESSTEDFTYTRYRRLLKAGLENKYQFVSFEKVRNSRRTENFECFLRHDCDNDLVAASRMAAVEAELDVQSTYFLMVRSGQYNLLAPHWRSHVESILSNRHWIGLHFDASIRKWESNAELQEAVEQEVRLIESEFKTPVSAVSFHQPSDSIIKNEIKIPRINTYDRKDMANVHYLSDSNMNWRGGHAEDFFRARTYPVIQVLVHPEWWTEQVLSIDKKWEKMFDNNFSQLQATMMSREAAYKTKFEVSFRKVNDA